MQHGMRVLSVGMIALVSVGVAADAGVKLSPASRVTVPVNVNVSCAGGAVQITVNPWVVRLQQGDDIDWVLDQNAQASTIEVAPKVPGRWAFAAARHQGGRGAANAARARNMRPNQRGNRYQYNITLSCQDGEETYSVVIDPDVEIED